MYRNCKLAGLLTYSQLELLKSLEELRVRKNPESFWTPKDLGAYRSSHHTHTLIRLVELGYVEKTVVSLAVNGRPKNAYRITAAGSIIWSEFVNLAGIRPEQVLGGHADKQRIQYAQRLLA